MATACGTTHENAPGASAGAGPATQACKGPGAAKFTICMSQANLGEPYRVRMDDDIRKAAASIPQFTVNFADAAQDNSKQVEQVSTFLTQKIDLLIISPNEATPLTSVVKKAYDQGIPVLVLDRKVDGDAYTSFIGADNVDIGRQAGRYFKEHLLPQGGKIVELKGLAGSTPAKERADGFDEGIAGSGITIVGTADADWLRDKGQQQADALLKAHPDAQAIFSENDPWPKVPGSPRRTRARRRCRSSGSTGCPCPRAASRRWRPGGSRPRSSTRPAGRKPLPRRRNCSSTAGRSRRRRPCRRG
ncbi:substrate-binding domain-containing protein [Amycolatopsis sp. NPDC049253]|uniref:substrate-binding domain-containing protein n=1 Tax=Amycolatopsis sp. NPDC049253 TaxID=3155274 RepID=UPI0034463510